MEIHNLLLVLTRLGIKHSHSVLAEKPDRKGIEALAERQGLTAIILDGISFTSRTEATKRNVAKLDRLSDAGIRIQIF